ncbi:unnamed protein product [Nezara viridula]|uniref:Uncharacterized protein n=1 Tax=Nezara viridula TaxID=85310 RepID=A0A9P0GXI2_NEZVI|nr:unnamed protein product [Nezara viridula]
MKAILCLVFLGSALAATRLRRQVYNQDPKQAPIVAYQNDVSFDGNYVYNYQTGNGISAQSEGSLKNRGQKDLEAQTARGSYSYTAPDGQVFTVNWYADETGYHAEGAHLPTPPPAAASSFRG